MPKGYSRKQWTAPDNLRVKAREKGTKEEVNDSKYDEYLFLLQQRNRALKKLKTKNDQQIELEQKEQGFSLYVNGAHTDLDVNRPRKTVRHHQKNIPRPVGSQRPSKTAGESRSDLRVIKNELQLNLNDTEGWDSRAKTAPEKTRRKNWAAASVDLKTNRGEKVKVKAPEILTGNYADDFEVDISYDTSSEDYSAESDDSDEVQLKQNLGHILFAENNSDSEVEEVDEMEEWQGEEEGAAMEEMQKDMVTLSLADVKKLRASLEMNSSIRESLALKEQSQKDVAHPQGIPEEDESIEEDLKTNVGIKSTSGLKANEYIVLEFAPTQKGKKEGKSLAVTRKADSDAHGQLRRSRQKPKEDVRQSSHKKKTKDLVLKPDSPLHKQARPLSASRRNQEETLDTTVEAKAVLDALKVENESLDKHRRTAKSAPGRHEYEERSPLPEMDPAARPSSTSSSWKNRLKATPIDEGLINRGVPTGIPEGNLDQIVQKVLMLDTKGQQRLLKALQEIDGKATEIPSKDSVTSPVKATVPVDHMVKPSGNTGPLEVVVELHSNWGDPSRIGLTEIQFFNLARKRIEVSARDVSVYGSRGVKGEVGALFNSKFKTTKDRNMWSCDYRAGKVVKLIITLKNKDPGSQFGISKIKLWNYNKTLQELGMGVRHARIVIGNDVAFDGEVDKGCGNQVFDYGKVILINDSSPTEETASDVVSEANPSKPKIPSIQTTLTPSVDNVHLYSDDSDARSPGHSHDMKAGHGPVPPIRSETRLLNHSVEPSLNRPVVDSISPKRKEKKVNIDETSIPKESEGAPKAVRKKRVKTPRKSKMAARLDGSTEATAASVEDEEELFLRRSNGHSETSHSHDHDRDIPPLKLKSPRVGSPRISQLSKSPRSPRMGAGPEEWPKVENSSLAPPRLGQVKGEAACSSPYTSDDDTPMLQQLRKINTEGGTGKPEWLKTSLRLEAIQ